MSWRVLVGVALALGVASAAAETQPSSKPATQPSVGDLKADLSAAQADLAGAQAQAVQDFDNSAAGRPLAAEVAARKAALEQARAAGTPTERLDASAAFNRARQALEDSRAGAIKASKAVSAAQAKVAAADASLAVAVADEKATADAQRAAEQERFRNDPIRIAIKKHQVIRGMTDDQVKKAMQFQNDPAKGSWRAERSIDEPGDGRTISTWHIGYTSRYQVQFTETRRVTVTEEAGVVVKVSQTILSELLDHEPQ
jgi:multidrug efflux pump subunit AcrA (membrane-fusion protein)